MDGTQGRLSDDSWADDHPPTSGLDMTMEKHEAYLRRKALRDEEKRRQRAARGQSADPDTNADPEANAARPDLRDMPPRAQQTNGAEDAHTKADIQHDRLEQPVAPEAPAVPVTPKQADAAPIKDATEPEAPAAPAPTNADRKALRKARRRRLLALAAAAETAEGAGDDTPEEAPAAQAPSPKQAAPKVETPKAAKPPVRTPDPVLTLDAADRVSEPPQEVAAQPTAQTPEPAETSATPPLKAAPDDAWARMQAVPLSSAHLAKNRVITANRSDPSHVAFDVLRTRLLAALRENGWKRVAITSPTKDCGKTFVAANLALSLSRQADCKTVLMDLDLRNPSLAKVMGVPKSGKIADFLTGQVPAADHFCVPDANDMNLGQNIAFGLNSRTENYAAELLLGPDTGHVLGQMEQELDPDVVLFDLPPALYHDDVIAFRPHFDGVLLVVGGGITKPKEIREVKRRLGENTPLLGVVMNKAEGLSISDYSY